MRASTIGIAIVLFTLVIMSHTAANLKYYRVNKTDEAIRINGKGDDTRWESAEVLTDFSYPWREAVPPATTFRALWDDTHFYFLYRAIDEEIICPQNGLGELDAVNSDRVEIFFKADDRMDPYYTLEMDALGRVFDAEGVYYRNVEHEWDWPEGHLTLQASIDEQGYWVEGAVSLASLRTLGLYQDNHLLKAGLFRGQYLTNEWGEIETHWISWILPDSKKPDFHIPSAFGVLKLIP